MGAIAGLDDLLAKATGGNNGNPENIWWGKTHTVAGVAQAPSQNREYSQWLYDGQTATGATPPTSAAAPDATTDGGLKQANPGGGRQKWMTGFGCWFSSSPAQLIIYDRLLHISGLSGTVTTAQTVGGSLTRYTGSAAWGNQAWVEIYSPIGGTATTVTMTYTNELGVSGQVSPSTAIGGASFQEQSRIFPIPLAAGDLGVQAVQDCTLAATTGTAGNFGITILRPLATFNLMDIGVGGHMTYLEQIVEVLTDACLAFIVTTHSSGIAPYYAGVVGMVEA